MARVSTYLNFKYQTEEAFNFYKSVFGGEFTDFGRMSEVPREPGQPELSDTEKNAIMHVALPILGGHLLMGTDVPESLGKPFRPGNNIYINLEPDSREELDRLFKQLSAGGEIEMEPQEMFWGDYFASCTDKFGVCWMLNTSAKE